MGLGSAVPGIEVNREARGRVRADGINLAFGYWPGAGRTVVALHGITASHASFVGVAQRLAGRRPLLALDLRGRGDSDKPSGPYGMVQHADDVSAAMDSFGLRGCVIVGHSMGAYVAVALAAAHPDKVSGLVLVDGGLPLETPAGVDAADLLDVVLAPQLARLSRTFDSEETYQDFWRSAGAFPSEAWGPWLHHYLAYDLGGERPHLRPKAAEAAVRADYLDTLDGEAVRARLRRVKVPMLLLRAQEGFYPGQPPLLSDELTVRECEGLDHLEDRFLAGTTHYTITLADPGAGIVADALVDVAARCGG